MLVRRQISLRFIIARFASQIKSYDIGSAQAVSHIREQIFIYFNLIIFTFIKIFYVDIKIF